MNADAIQRVTAALRGRLGEAIADPAAVYSGPLDDAAVQNAALVLYLHRVAPNAGLRNREHLVASDNPPPAVIAYRDALPLDLHYVIAIGKRAGNPEALQGLLGLALQRLQAEPEIGGAPVGHEPVRLSMEPLSTEELGRIWALFPAVNYRTSVAYVATPVWIDPKTPPLAAERVREDRLDAGALAGEEAARP